MQKRKFLLFGSLPILLSGPIGILALMPSLALKNYRINKYLFDASFFLITFFIIAFALSLNQANLRVALLVFVNIILFSIVFSPVWLRSGEYIADALYFINIAILFLSAISARFSALFVVSGLSSERIGGLLGFDFVAPFVAIYLISKVESGRLKPNYLLLTNVVISTIVVLNSGRFGFLVLLILYIYLIKKFYSFGLVILIALILSLLYAFSFERMNLIINTLYGIFEYLMTNSEDVFDGMDLSANSGFYAASPLTWIAEFNMIFERSYDILYPSKLYVLVDSGPAFLLMNSGLILAILFYFVFCLFLRSAGVSFFIIAVILVYDLKFRMAFSLLPMFWIYINASYSGRSFRIAC